MNYTAANLIFLALLGLVHISEAIDPWSITFEGNPTVGFGDGFTGSEVVLEYEIDDKPFDVKVFEENCYDSVDESIIKVLSDHDATYDGSILDTSDLTVTLDIEPGLLQAATGLWDGDNFTICVLVELGTEANILGDGGGFTGVNYHELILTVYVDFTLGFTITEIAVQESAPLDVGPEEAAIMYGVSACQCFANNATCADSPDILDQSDELVICISTTSDEIDLASVSSLEITQGLMTFTAINNGTITDDSLTGTYSYDAKTLIVETQLLSLFFDEAEGTVDASGTVEFVFSNTGVRRKLSLAVVGEESRKLQEGGGDGSAASYGVNGIRVLREEEEKKEAEPTNGGGFPVMIVALAAVGFVVASLFIVVVARRKSHGKEDVRNVKDGENVVKMEENVA